MRYLPKSPAERQEMLAAIGVKSIEELFSSIPERFRLREPLKIPGRIRKPKSSSISKSARRRIRTGTRVFSAPEFTIICAPW